MKQTCLRMSKFSGSSAASFKYRTWLNLPRRSLQVPPQTLRCDLGRWNLGSGSRYVSVPHGMMIRAHEPSQGSGQGALSQILTRDPQLFGCDEDSTPLPHSASEIYSFVRYVHPTWLLSGSWDVEKALVSTGRSSSLMHT